MNIENCSKSSYKYNCAASASSYTSAAHGEESDSAPPVAEKPSCYKSAYSKAKKKKAPLCGVRFADPTSKCNYNTASACHKFKKKVLCPNPGPRHDHKVAAN